MVVDEKDLKFHGLTEYELDSLKLFHEQIEKINNSRIIEKDSLKGSTHIEINENGIKAEANLPDDDDLRSLLLLISPLVRTKERINYNEILSILRNRSENNESRSYFDLLQTQYKASLKSGLRYGANGKEYGDEDIFRLLLNGYYFHSDDDKREKLEDLKGLPYAAESALLGTLCVHVSWLRFIDKLIVDRINTLKK
jgi:hypothetical protein